MMGPVEEEDEEFDQEAWELECALKASWKENAKKAAASKKADEARKKPEEASKKEGIKIIGGREVNKRARMSTWEQGGHRYHLNLTHGDTNHITREGNPKVHYFFTLDAGVIKSARPTREEAGQHSEMFHRLPEDVQAYVRTHINELC